MIIIIAISTFVCISLALLGVYWLVYKPQSAATQRLRHLGVKDGGGADPSNMQSVVLPDESPAADFAQRLTQPLNKLVPVSATEAKKLQKQLMHAGFRSAEAPMIYRGIHLASMAGFPLLVTLVCAILAYPLQNALLYIMFAFVAGFFLPRYMLGRITRNRQRDLRWGLADALDLMVISVEAGLGLKDRKSVV